MDILTFTTDFGAGLYVAQMKGIALSIHPEACIVDLAHNVAAGDVREGAVILEAAAPAFPEGSVHVVVVDPGVGTPRRVLYAKKDGRRFVGPDNGVLTPFLKDAEDLREVTNADLFLPRVSATFHGRDVFAPAGAHLLAGAEPDSLGERPTDPPVLLPDLWSEGEKGAVLSVDHFGNLVTSFRASLLYEVPEGRLTGPGRSVSVHGRTFAEQPPETPFLYAGSGGRLEVAVNRGSAARTLGWSRGTKIEYGEGA